MSTVLSRWLSRFPTQRRKSDSWWSWLLNNPLWDHCDSVPAGRPGRSYRPGIDCLLEERVLMTATSLSLAGSPAVPVYGQNLALTTTLAAEDSSSPVETIDIYDGTTLLGHADLNGMSGNDQATFNISTLAVGSHTLTASFAGDGTYDASTSDDLSQAVGQASSSTGLTSDNNPSVYGQLVTLTATVSVVSPGAGTPTGPVAFLDNGTSLGSGTVNSSGIATFQTSSLSLGDHPYITASYAGDTNCTGSSSSNYLQVINQAQTTTTLSADGNPSVYGQTVTFTVTVSDASPGNMVPTGYVTFVDGASTLGSVAVDSSGIATFQTSALSLGTHADISASYAGDTNNAGSCSSSFSQVVNKAQSVMALSADVNPSAYGQTVTVSATITVQGPGSGTPTGTVSFFDNGMSLGFGTVNSSGIATVQTSSLSLGTHAYIWASYSGDADYEESASGNYSEVVDSAHTSTTLSVDVNPSLHGQTVTFTVTVTDASPGGLIPTGTITLLDNGSIVESGTLYWTGTSIFEISTLSLGDHPHITAAFAGNETTAGVNFAGSSSTDCDEMVKALTSTTVTADHNGSVYGQTVTFTAPTTIQSPGWGTATGSTSFFDGSTYLGTAILDSSGVATFQTRDLSPGNHTITAHYAGDANNGASVSANYTQLVYQDATSTTLTSDFNPSTYGESVQLTGLVSAASPGSGNPTGTVSFYNSGSFLASRTVDGFGSATIQVATLSLGTHPHLTVVYGGDGDFWSSTSANYSQYVGLPETDTELTANVDPSAYGQAVTFRASVRAKKPGAGTPSGTVDFLDHGTYLGSGTLDSSGVATFQTSDLGVGDHFYVTASYQGDDVFVPSHSINHAQVVFQPAGGPGLWVLDANKAIVLTPGLPENDFAGWSEDLRAQVVGVNVAGYAWNLGSAPDAGNISGNDTYNLQFTWSSFTGAPRNEQITLTVINSDSTTFVQTFTFQVTGTGSPAWSSAVTSASTWAAVLAPDALQAGQATAGGPYFSLGLASGEFQTGYGLPSYNPGLSAAGLTYSSTAADPRPIFIEHYELDPTQAVPATVTAQLTLDGVTCAAVTYDTSLLNPGDVMEIALQANASSLATGRYAYEIDVSANYDTPATTTQTGQVTVINESASTFGPGWSLDGLEKLYADADGVILDLGAGQSLWFAAGQQAGSFVTPAGEFSTLVQNFDDTYTQSLTNGTQVNFSAAGRETSIVDRNGNHTAYAYTSGQITSITDMNGQVTSLAHNTSGLVSTITDPASRVVQVAYDSSGRLTSFTGPNSGVWSYAYTNNLITGQADPLLNSTAIVYNSAGRVSSVTRPDSLTEQLTAVEMIGLAAAGSTGVTPVLAVQAQAAYTDARDGIWLTDLDWLGLGSATQALDPLGDQAVTAVDANGLPWLDVDALGRRTARTFFDGAANPTEIVWADDADRQYTCNSFGEVTSYTNELGDITSYTFDSVGNLTQVTNALDQVSTFTFDTKGSVLTATDTLGHTTTYAYDSLNRETSATDPLNYQVTYGYDSAGNVTSRTNENGFTTIYTYNVMGQLTADILPDSDPNVHPTYSYTYDLNGNNLTATDPLGNVTTYTFDTLDELASETDPAGDPTFIHDGNGNVISTTDAMNRTAQYNYDPANRPTTTVNSLGYVTNAEFDPAGENIKITNAQGGTTVNAYSERGLLVATVDPAGNETDYDRGRCGCIFQVTIFRPDVTPEVIFYTKNALGQVTAITDPRGGVTNFGYDGGNLAHKTDPKGLTTVYAHDLKNRLASRIDPTGDPTFTYDGVGNLTSETDALNRTTSYTYDPRNELLTVTDPLGGVTSYTYDLDGHVTSITDSVGNTTSYTYDAAGNRKSTTDAYGHATTYVYNADHELIAETDRDGRRRTFTYDQGGQETAENWLNASGTIIHTIAYAYDALGNLLSESDSNSAYAYQYSPDGQVTQVDNAGTANVPHVILTYGYDAFGNQASVRDDMGGTIEYAHDLSNNMTGVSMTIAGVLGPQVALTYDADNLVTGMTRSEGSGAATITSAFTHDDAGNLTGITHASSQTGTLASYTYDYDLANELITYTGPEGTLHYTYDLTGQLTGVTGSRTETYSYDHNGNRTMTGYTTGTNNRLTSDGTYNYTYDNEGNTLTKTRISDGQVTTNTWDYRNRLTEVVIRDAEGNVLTHDVFTYDVNDLRIGKSVNGVQTWTVYSDGNPYLDFAADGSLTNRYLYGQGLDSLLAKVGHWGTKTWYLTDLLGSVRELVTMTGTVLDQIAYDSYGKTLTETHPSQGDRLKYAGREWDVEIGLYYDRERYVNPATGTFESEDPTGFGGRDSNLFRYVQNNPVLGTDPFGTVSVFLRGYGGSSSGEASTGSSNESGGSSKAGGSSDSGHGSSGGQTDPADDYKRYGWVDKKFEYHEIEKAIDYITSKVGDPEHQSEPIVLIGHSYGGDSALTIARKLGEKGYQVDFLATLDPITGPTSNIMGSPIIDILGSCVAGSIYRIATANAVDLPANVKQAWNWRQTIDHRGVGTRIKGAWDIVDAGASEDINSLRKGDILTHTDLDDDPAIAEVIKRHSLRLHGK